MEQKQANSAALGWCMVALQFFFAISWTAYVLYLPKLLQQAGAPRAWLLPLLMADQVVFAVTDLLVGVQADRMRASMRRYGSWIAIAATLSCAAFLALPFVAPALGAPALLVCIFVWAVASAALRVPPVMMLERHLAKPALPWLAAIVALGLGLAAVLAPFMTAHLRDLDPRLPFILVSVALLVTVFALLAVERRAGPPPAPATTARLAFTGIGRRAALFVVAILVLALGFQVHTNIASPKLFQPFTALVQLPVLMSIFWIGFNFAVMPAGKLSKRFGGLRMTAGAAVIGGAAIAVTLSSKSLPAVALAQGIAGAAWGTVVVSAFASALLIGGADGAGRVLGLTFASFAVATFGRMALTYAGLAGDPALFWSPTVIWIVAGLTLALLAAVLRLAWPREPAPE